MQVVRRVNAGAAPLQALVSQAAIASQGAAAPFVPKRNAVNLSALKLRIRATNNVAKITNVMKLVASSKLKSVEEALARGRVFGESILNAVALPDEKRKDLTSKEKADDDAAKGIFLDDKKHLITVVTTDRGLCGAVNSSLTRALRKELNAAARAKSSVRLFVLGDKGRAQVSRDYVPIVARTIDSCFDKDPIFPLAAAIATKIVKEPYDILTLWYNHYENQVKFHNVYKKIPQLANMPVGVLPPSLKGYDIEPDNNEETLVNMQEYAVASALYFAMLETTACETSQRVTAMDNASTNAKDMVDRFKLQYNRARQYKITTELTEIISGAEASQAAATED
jgi:ATP synthase F1 gamma subunit